MRILLTFVLCLNSFIVCDAQSSDYILDKVIYDLYEVFCKGKGVSRGDTMFIPARADLQSAHIEY